MVTERSSSRSFTRRLTVLPGSSRNVRCAGAATQAGSDRCWQVGMAALAIPTAGEDDCGALAQSPAGLRAACTCSKESLRPWLVPR